MKTPQYSILPIGAACLAAGIVSTHGQVLLNDTWADGSRGETSLPAESAVWVSHSGGVTMNPGSLLFDQTASSGSQKLWTYFAPDGAPVTVGVGQQLITTIQFIPRTALYDNSSRSFRVGLFNDPTDAQVMSDINSDSGDGAWTDATGYGVQIALSTGASASTSANVGKRTDLSNSSLMGSSGAWTFDSGGNDIVNTLDTSYTITLALDRTAADMMDFTFTISDGGGVISTHSITDDPNGSGAFGVDPIATQFDQLFFRFSNNTSTADAIEFTQFRVELVPEPSTFALLGLGSLALAFARRRS